MKAHLLATYKNSDIVSGEITSNQSMPNEDYQSLRKNDEFICLNVILIEKGKLFFYVSVAVLNIEGHLIRIINCLVVKYIFNCSSSNKLNWSGIKIFKFINLSDENFHVPEKIDGLIGNELFF